MQVREGADDARRIEPRRRDLKLAGVLKVGPEPVQQRYERTIGRSAVGRCRVRAAEDVLATEDELLQEEEGVARLVGRDEVRQERMVEAGEDVALGGDVLCGARELDPPRCSLAQMAGLTRSTAG